MEKVESIARGEEKESEPLENEDDEEFVTPLANTFISLYDDSRRHPTRLEFRGIDGDPDDCHQLPSAN